MRSNRIGHLTLVPKSQAFIVRDPLEKMIGKHNIPPSFGIFELVVFTAGEYLCQPRNRRLLSKAVDIFKQRVKKNCNYLGPGVDDFRRGGINKVDFHFEINPSEKAVYLIIVGTHIDTPQIMEMEDLLFKY